MYSRYRCLLSVGLLLVAAGCAHGRTASRPEAIRARTGSAGPQASAERVEPNGVVTLADAVSFALVNHPALHAFPWARQAAEARELQARLLPNPELEFEIEEFGGAGDRRGFDGAETSLQLGQLIELGDKRFKRTRLAEIDKDLTQWDYESQKLDVMYKVTLAFIETLAAQEQMSPVQELVGLSERTYEAVQQRVTAGKDPPVDQAKARVAVANARLGLARAERQLDSVRAQLALAWGSKTPRFDSVRGDFYRIAPIPAPDDLTPLMADNPDLARWEAQMRRRWALLEVEKAKRVPDVGLRAGVRHFNETDDTAFVMGFSIPLPAFDRNQGGIEAAGQMLAKTRDDRETALMAARTALARALESASVAFVEANVLADDVLPMAQSAYEATDEGYRQGKFNYLQVLDAQRTLFEAKLQYVTSLATYHRSRATIERLIGQALPEPEPSATPISTSKPLSEELSDEK
ncbi:MAG: TolC family protein [Phycisphaerales bacterium]|nr:MAG: TolC family protein [Phycisphaerales bacterium]